MKKNPLYRSGMDKVHAPDSLKDKVLQAAARERARAGRAAPADGRAPRQKHPVLRPAVAACCAAALVLGAAAVGAMTAGSGSGSGAGNSFVLTAYAAGEETGATPAVSAPAAAGIKSFDFSGKENITDFPNNRVIQDFQFDLNCEGSHIQSLKYEISGAAFTIAAPAYVDSGSSNPKLAGGVPTDPYETMPKQKTFSSFSAKPGDDLSSYRIRCVAPLTAQETAALKAEKESTLYTAAGDLGPGYTIKDVKINSALNGTVVSVTATFADGATQTKRYQLSAVDNYLEAVAAQKEAVHAVENAYQTDPAGMTTEAYEAKLEELEQNAPPLYCITELK